MFNRLDTILVCDRWMDGQTSCHGIVCAMHMHHTVKMQTIVLCDAQKFQIVVILYKLQVTNMLPENKTCTVLLNYNVFC